MLSLEKQYKKQDGHFYGIVQSETFGSPTVSGNLGSQLGSFGENVVRSAISDTITATGLAIGASADSVIGFSSGGLLIGLGADIGKKYNLILLIRLQNIIIHSLIEYGILVILFSLLVLTPKQVCHHLDLD